MIKHLFFICIATLLLTGCNPKVLTSVSKVHPTHNDYVAVFYQNTESIPEHAEALGQVKVKDNGFVFDCDSARIVNIIKNETMKIGGNAVLITKHKRPSAFGSTCHQMEASIFRINNIEEFKIETNNTPILMPVKSERQLPKIHIALDGGYGWRTAKISSDLNTFQRDFIKGLKNGPAWGAAVKYYFNDNYGIGINFSTYSAFNNMYVKELETNRKGDLDGKDKIRYIGPTFACRFSSNQKWIFYVDIGLGYINYVSQTTFLNDKTKLSGASGAFFTSLGAEYKFSKNLGVGMNLNTISGTLSKVTIEENGVKSTYELENKQQEGLGHITIQVGLRYHIN